MIRAAVLAVSAALTLCAAIPYIRDILRGTTRPRVASWAVWASATGIGAAAALSRGQWLAGLFLGACAAEDAAVAVLGWRHGDRGIGWLDGACAAGAAAGLVLLVLVRAPVQAAAAAVAVDLAAGIPTVRHAWAAPHEETWSEFAWCGLAAALVLAAAGSGQVTGAAYPAYLAVFDAGLVLVILARRRAVTAEPVLERPYSAPLMPDDDLRWFERPEWYEALRASGRRAALDRAARVQDRATWLCTDHRLGWCRECARCPRPWMRRPPISLPGPGWR